MIRSVVRSAFLTVAGTFSRPSKGVHLLNGHFLARNDHLDRAKFTALLKSVRNYAQFLDVRDAVQLITSGECQRFDGVALAFTFDDGFLDCYTGIAPVLADFNTNACFFINPGFIDGTDEYRRNFSDNVVKTPGKQPMTWEQVRRLNADGFVIGNHTIDHCRLPELSAFDLAHQIVGSRDYIAQRIGENVDYFAWPYGRSCDISPEALSVACSSHKYVFGAFGFRNYFVFDGKALSRRHFEPDWNPRHLRYFLSGGKQH